MANVLLKEIIKFDLAKCKLEKSWRWGVCKNCSLGPDFEPPQGFWRTLWPCQSAAPGRDMPLLPQALHRENFETLPRFFAEQGNPKGGQIRGQLPHSGGDWQMAGRGPDVGLRKGAASEPKGRLCAPPGYHGCGWTLFLTWQC